MPKQLKTPFEIKFEARPSYIKVNDFVDALNKEGIDISRRTFERYLKANPSSIPHEVLRVSAGLLDCEIDDLINSYNKIKPIIRKNLSRKSGLKVK